MNHGAQQLRDWMRRRGFNQREMANFFGWEETFISKLLNGDRTPRLRRAVQIERHTGVPVEAWVSSELPKSNPDNGPKGRKTHVLTGRQS